MKCYTYTELKDDLLLTFEKGLKNNENSVIEAVSYCYIIYEADLGYGLDERVLISLLLGKIMLEHTSRLFIGQYKMFENAAKEAIEKQFELNLTPEERSEVVKWADEVLNKLPKMEIEYDPGAK
jgi:hypothetical protein